MPQIVPARSEKIRGFFNEPGLRYAVPVRLLGAILFATLRGEEDYLIRA